MAKKYYLITYEFEDFLLNKIVTRKFVAESKNPKLAWEDFILSCLSMRCSDDKGKLKPVVSVPILIDISRIK